mgnify:CR=1 FL=1
MTNYQFFTKKHLGYQRYKKRAEKLLFWAKVPNSFAQPMNQYHYRQTGE